MLVLVNLLSVNLAGLLTLWYAGYRPENLFALGETEQRVRRRIVGLGIVVFVFAVFLGGITYASYTTGSFEQDARNEIETVLGQEQYDRYQLLEFEVVLDDDYPFRDPQRVIVPIGGPPGESAPQLADRFYERINDHADESVTIEIRYVETLER